MDEAATAQLVDTLKEIAVYLGYIVSELQDIREKIDDLR